MFDIGFAEVLVLTVIALVVIGPEKLPAVARTVGRTVGKAKRTMSGLQNQIEQELKIDELNKKIMEETKDMDFTQPTIHPETPSSKSDSPKEDEPEISQSSKAHVAE